MHWLILISFLFASLANADSVKPNQLSPITNSQVSTADLFMLFDSSVGITKKLSVGELDSRYGGGVPFSPGTLSSGTTGVTVTGGTNAVNGAGTSISVQTASDAQPGLLSSADHTSYAASAVLTAAATSSNTNSAIVKRDGSGNFSATTVSAALTGNASTATALAANPTDCSAGQYASAIAANGNLTCANPFTGMVESYNGQIETAAEKTYEVDHYASYAKQITNIRVKCTSGSVTLALKIGGTNITTCSAISVTTSDATTTCDTGASNDLAANGQLTMVLSSNSSCTDLVWTIKTSRD